MGGVGWGGEGGCPRMGAVPPPAPAVVEGRAKARAAGSRSALDLRPEDGWRESLERPPADGWGHLRRGSLSNGLPPQRSSCGRGTRNFIRRSFAGDAVSIPGPVPSLAPCLRQSRMFRRSHQRTVKPVYSRCYAPKCQMLWLRNSSPTCSHMTATCGGREPAP